MSKSNEDIDEIIKKALSQEEAKFYDELEEQNLPEMFLGIYQGKLKWIVMIATVMQLVLTGVAVYCAYMFFTVDEVKPMIIWGIVGLFFVQAVSMLKLYHWLQIDKNSIIREVKRMELQMSMLNKRLEKAGN